MATATLETHAAAVLERVIKPNEKTLSPAVARALLRMELDANDRQRLHELAERNQNDRLTAVEREELQGYLTIGMVLDLLQAKARVPLAQTAARR